MMSEKPSPTKERPIGDAIIVDNSPIEFILFGPKGVADGVLVRTRNAGLELIGLTTEGLTNQGTRSSPNSALLLLGFNYHPECSLVRSTPTGVSKVSDDKRLGTFTLSWFGVSSASDLERIQGEFNRRVADLQGAIADRDKEQVEWFLGPVVALCARANRKRRLSRNLITVMIIIYIIFAIIVVSVRFLSPTWARARQASGAASSRWVTPVDSDHGRAAPVFHMGNTEWPGQFV